jgi:hypothetical protein
MKLTITVFSKDNDFSPALDCVKKQVERGFLYGFDGGEDDNFQYSVEKEQEEQKAQ